MPLFLWLLLYEHPSLSVYGLSSVVVMIWRYIVGLVELFFGLLSQPTIRFRFNVVGDNLKEELDSS
jgi:hypothetical protein